MQKDLEALKSAKSELEARAKVRESENYPFNIGYKTENKGQATEYTNFVNEEGAILSDKHIGRRGNGLDLEGDTNLARTLSFMDEVDKAENPIKIKIVKILSRKALYDGRETLNNYYVMQRL